MEKKFIIDGAKCVCKFGTATGLLKVKSHQLLIVNHGNRKIATTQELKDTFYPPAFVSCTYYSPFIKKCKPVVTQWTKFYKKMRVQGKAYPLLPESKAICQVSGTPCIEIVDHGQKEIPGELHFKNLTAEYQAEMNPIGNAGGEDKDSITANVIRL